jgi:hypothetical protein
MAARTPEASSPDALSHRPMLPFAWRSGTPMARNRSGPSDQRRSVGSPLETCKFESLPGRNCPSC